MKKRGRYDVSGLIEAQYETGSAGKVLRNLLGIIDSAEMDLMETLALAKATDRLIRKYDKAHQFSAADIRSFHKIWLGELYVWAGAYRKVNITKDEFTFASAAQIPKLMYELECNQLARYTPCIFKDLKKTARALAEVHTELLLIHPFRDGNGRVARLLSTLMALQGGLPLLDFSLLGGEKKKDYILTVHSGLDRNYEPMKDIFSEIIERSISGSAADV